MVLIAISAMSAPCSSLVKIQRQRDMAKSMGLLLENSAMLFDMPLTGTSDNTCRRKIRTSGKILLLPLLPQFFSQSEAKINLLSHP